MKPCGLVFRKQEGFVQKELWQSPEDSEKLHAVIWWRDKDSWKAITDEQIRIVDMEMGDYLIEPEMSEFLVITDPNRACRCPLK